MKRLKFFWPYLSNKNPIVGRQETTPFHFVAYYGLSDIADFMLEELQSVEDCLHENTSSKTPLHYACINGHAEIIRSLRRTKDFEFINPKWFAKSLYEAIENGHLDCVKALLDKQTSDFKKNLASDFKKNLPYIKLPYFAKSELLYRNSNPVDFAKHFYSKTKNQNHHKIVKYLSQLLELSTFRII